MRRGGGRAPRRPSWVNPDGKGAVAGMLFFFYGTLMDRELRARLLGARRHDLRVTPGALINRRRFRARDGDFPVLVPELGGRVTGVFVEGLDAHSLLWVAHFEGPWYLPDRVTAFDEQRRRLRPWTFRPTRRSHASDAPWDFRRWQRTGKPQVRAQLNTWLLQRQAGQPMALDAPWLARRRVCEVAALGDDQPQPNPHLQSGAIAAGGLDEGDDHLATAAE
jgi:hypothetical protein